MLTDKAGVFCAQDGRFFYKDAQGQGVFEYDLQSGKKTQVLDKQVGQVFLLGDWLIYVDLDNGTRIAAYNMTEKTETVLTGSNCMDPVISQNQMYYIDNNKGYICCKDLVSGEIKEFPELKTTVCFIMSSERIMYFDTENNDAVTYVSRNHMSNVQDENAPYETAFVIEDAYGMYYADELSVIYDTLDSQGYSDGFVKCDTYYDGDIARWKYIE